MRLKILKRLLIPCLISLLVGCASTKAYTPKLQEEIVIIKKPKIESIQDFQNAYIELFRAYKHNTTLLEILNKNLL